MSRPRLWRIISLAVFSWIANGIRVAVGTAQDPTGVDPRLGHVRIYDWEGSQWTQVGFDSGVDIPGAGKYLWEVKLSSDGNRVAIGVPASNSTDTVRIYDWTGSEWTNTGSNFERKFDDSSIALSSDCNRIAISTTGISPNGLGPFISTVVHVYKWSGANGSRLDLT